MQISTPARYLLAALSGTLYFLGFAGFGIWPLSFVALLPILFALDPAASPSPLPGKHLFGMGLLFGLVTNLGGYYWLGETLQRFSGFPFAICMLIASIVFTYQGGVLVLFAWLFRRLREFGWGVALAASTAMCLGDWIFPRLFPHYFGNSLHSLPLVIQVADLGGPVLVTGLLTAANAALYGVLMSLRGQRLARMELGGVVLAWLLAVGYGAYRIHEVDERSAAAPKLSIGIVQADMGLMAKRSDPMEGLRRHIEQSEQLQREHKLDLIVWPETAFAWFMPEGLKDASEVMPIGTRIRTPLLFGGLARREVNGRKRPFNTAFLADKDGTLLGTYDKTFLLAFSEYIPFGERFPILYEWSPNSGQFVPGNHVRPLELGDVRISALICYEDILPSFVREMVREGNPHLLINLTNDAWFGDTHEPWEHLALAQFRSVEHHRALVRSTNSGVTAVVDPAGRVVVKSGVFTRESLHAEVPLLTQATVYETVGDFPGWLALFGVVFAFVKARRSRS
jgi:apolipoprotein N-acyltransferase